MSKPVILTVDDEPEVLNAVERDLRKQYAAEYRIVKASSGAQALDAVRQLKQRNAAVALFLVDARMPKMSGTEFLIEARRIYPDARKVMLTAYADTDVAIAGINEVQLDHYLMKPWDPPAERLYPVLDDLLGDWSASFRPPFEGIRVVGSLLSPKSHEVKDFLSRNLTPYQWVDVEQDVGARAEVEAASPGLRQLPLVSFPDGTTLLEPSTRALAEKLGLQTTPSRPFYDLVIVGGGPTGLAAAVYGGSEGLRTVIVERETTGGQAGTSAAIENYLGFPSGVSGADLARRATAQAKRFGAEVLTAREVTKVRVDGPYRLATLDDGSELACYALLLACGMQVRRLEVPGVEALTGAGVFYGAALTEAAACRGKDVLIVGGANSAGQAALSFARYARKVTMLVRGASLTEGMSMYLVDRITAAANIEVLAGAEVVAAQGTDRLETVDVALGDTREVRRLEAAAMFIFIGARPRSEVAAGLVERDPGGFILTGLDLRSDGKLPRSWPLARDPFLLETSVPGVFAAGDVRQGSSKRVAAAVGEGSSAVGMVHKYLETV
ncbi:MAG: chemotaxis protein CheY [Gemmatimonas sp. SG8_28]|jgi:thioredoxin reductase (NADPH)|nr:MAG: chemotaxis protein CheY [Gemmatimonas sp. SG8_28]